MGVKQLHQLGEIGKGAGEAIDLVDDDDIDQPGPDVGEKKLEGRAVGKRLRERTQLCLGIGRQLGVTRRELDIGQLLAAASARKRAQHGHGRWGRRRDAP